MTTQDWNVAGGLPPELDIERQRLKRQQAIAEALLASGNEPLRGQMAGRFYVPASPFEGMANMLNIYSGAKGRADAEKGMADLGKRYQEGLAAEVQKYTRAKTGTPESSEVIVDEQANDGEGAQATITAPAIEGDPRKAILDAMMSPYAPVQRVAQMDLTQLNRTEDREDQQAFRAQEAQLAREQREADLKARIAFEEAAGRRADDLKRELAQMQQRGREELLRLTATMRPAPPPRQEQIIQTAQGPMRLVNGQAVPITGPGGVQIKPPSAAKGAAPLSATAQKELFEADDVSNSAKNAIDILESIIAKDPKTKLSQNDQAFEGGTANLRRIGMSFVPGEYQGENASVDLQNKVTGQALENLKAIFGGMPTEGERKVLIEIQGSLNQKASQREAIFKRAIDLAKRRMSTAQDKAKRLREGTYFGAGVATNQDGGSVLDQADAILRATGGNR